MIKNIFFLLIIYFFSIFSFYAQSEKIDSLKHVLKTSKVDTSKVNTLNQLCSEYIKNQQYDTVLVIADLNIKNSIKLHFTKGEADALFNIAMVYYNQDFHLEATNYFLKAIDKFIVLADKKALAKCNGNIGTLYYRQSLYPKALEYQTKSLKLNTEIDNKMGIAICYLAMSNIYIELLKYEKAIEYAKKSIQIREQINDKKGIASCLLSIGIVYAYQYNYESALKYMNESLNISKELANQKGIAKALENIGIIYREKKMYREAINNYNEALVIFREQGQKHAVASTLIHIANLYNELGDYIKARPFLKEAEEISIEMNTLDFRGLVYQSYAQNFYLTKNYKQAYDYQVKYKEVMDTIFNKENSQQLSDIKTQFEVEKKEAELKTIAKIEKEKILIKTQEDKKRQNIIIMGVLGVLLLVSIFSVFIFRGLQENKKANKIITAQKNEVEHQKHLVDEKQKEILDSITYAKRLQQAILPPISYIEAYLPDNFVLYKPKDIVAGDFYWMHVVEKDKEKKIYIAAADSTGHGVPGAMVSLVCSNALDKATNDFDLCTTGEILDKTTDLVLETFAKSGEEIKDGMDISILCIDLKHQKISWSGANNPLWIIRKNESEMPELVEFKADKQPIGKNDYRKPFTTHDIKFEFGTTFYLMTDGYADQFGGPKGKKYKYKQLEELLVNNCSMPLLEQKRMLENAFENWRGDLEQVDDVTIIGIKI